MTTIALYSNDETAQTVYDQLIEKGIKKGDISFVARDPQNHDINSDVSVAGLDTPASDVTGGTASGLVTGAAIGFLAGAAALVIPGFGALLVSGPLTAALGGSALAANTALGATIGATGGLVAGLVKAGFDLNDAKQIEESLHRGGIMIAIKDDQSGTYTQVLKDNNPESIIAMK